MINKILVFYDNSLLYSPNSTFLFFFILFAFLLFLFFRCLRFFARSLRSMATIVRQIYTKGSFLNNLSYYLGLRPFGKYRLVPPFMAHLQRKKRKKIRIKQFILLGRKYLRVLDNIEKKVLNRIHKIFDAVAREVLIPVIVIFFISVFSGILSRPVVFAQKPSVTAYQFPWPGILPDHPFYKLKVLRNKIIYNIIYSPVKRVEFDLLMADKMLYASKLLLDKGEGDLAKETALKGENYFSILVADYARVKQRNEIISGKLRTRIDQAYEAHQQLIDYLGQKAPEADKKTYQDIDFFSDENYRVLQNIDNPQPEP